MPDPFDDMLAASDAAATAVAEQRSRAQAAHDATGTGERLLANAKEGLWGLQGSMAGLVGAGQTRQEAQASVLASKAERGASADTTGEQVLGAAIESSPMTLASFLPAYLLRVPASRMAASRVLAQAAARGMPATSQAVQRIATLAAQKAGDVAARVGMGASMGAMSMPDAYDDAKAAGLGTGAALVNAAGAGLTEGAFTYLMPGAVESAGLSRPVIPGLARTLGQGVRRVAMAPVKEGFEEGATELAHIAREQALGVQNGPMLSDRNLARVGMSAGAGAIMGPGFEAPGMVEDAARQLPQAVAPHVLAARLAMAQPAMDGGAPAPVQAEAAGPDGPSYADLVERTLAAEAVRRGLPPDFTPLPPVPQGPAGQGFAGYAEAQPVDQATAMAALFQAAQAAEQPVPGTIPPEVPDAATPPQAPAPVAPGPVPGAAPPVAGEGTPAPPAAPVAPQPAPAAAPDLVARHRQVARETARWRERVALERQNGNTAAARAAFKNAGQTEKILRAIEARMSPEQLATIQPPASRQEVPPPTEPAAGRPGVAAPGPSAQPQPAPAPAVPPRPVAGPSAPEITQPAAAPAPSGQPAAAVEQAAAQAASDPTEAQKEAGNYAKGHVRLHGMDITIENRKGGTRSGTDRNGKPWSVTMPAHYGYVKGTTGADGDHVDVYIGPSPAAKRVFVVDQVDAESKAFDEHKAMIGFPSIEAATAAYDAGFSDGKGPQRRAAVTTMGMAQFKQWATSRQAKKPLAKIKEPAHATPQPVPAPAVEATASAPAPSPAPAKEVAEGKPVAHRAPALRESAARVRQKAQDELNRDRNTNTPKRAREASSAVGEAMRQERLAKIADRIADAQESGQGDGLETIASIQDIDAIMTNLRHGRMDRMSYAEEQQKKDSAFTDEDVTSAINKGRRGGFVNEGNVRDALKQIEGTKGAPALRKAIGSPNTQNGYRVTDETQAKALLELAKRVEITERYSAKAIREGVADARRWMRLGATTYEGHKRLLTAFLPFQQDTVDPEAKRRAELKAKEDAIRFIKIPGFFPTPPALADETVRKADIQPGMRVLEPEGGKGDLAQRIEAAGGKVDVAETQSSLREILESKGFNLVGRDMLEIQPPADGPVYDRIVMNPPFENGQDREHVRHAYDLLKPGGRLVAIMSPGPFQRSFKADQEFKAWAESVGAVVEDNEAGSFAGKEAFRQTGVHTVTVTINKPAAPAEAPASPVEAQAEPATLEPSPATEPYAELLSDPMASDIPLAAAMRGHSGTSMVPEQRARGEVADYVRHLRDVRDRLNGIAKTPEQQTTAEAEFARYRAGYRMRRLDALSKRGRVMSAMVAGPSKFPVASNRKRSDSYEKSVTESVDWSERAQKAAIKAVRAAAPGGDPTAPVSSDDADAVTKLKGKIDNAERLQAAMIAGNRVVRDKKLTDDQKVAKLVELGLTEARAREALKPDFAGNLGFPAYALTNNNANIRRMKERVEELERKRGQESRSVTVGDITVSDDVEGNRLRLTFPGKPEPGRLRNLKAAGFKWSPKEMAWQRMRGDSAIAAAENALGIDLSGLREQQAAPATPAPETWGDTAPSAPEQPAPEAAAPNPEPAPAEPKRKPSKLRTAEAEVELRRVADPVAVQRLTEQLYRLVNAVGDPNAGNGEVIIKKRENGDAPEFLLDISGPAGEATTGSYTTEEALREAGIELGAFGRFRFDDLTKHLERIDNAITGRNIKHGTVGKAKSGLPTRDFGAGVKQDQLKRAVPDLPRQKAYSQREDDARPAMLDLEAINKDMKTGRVVAVPGGWRFVAPSGRGIAIRSATAAEARDYTGAEGVFVGADSLTGEPEIVLIPGRTGAFTVNHELVHHARRLGILTDGHVDALVRIGTKHGVAAKWGKAYRQAQPDIAPQVLREEIAAKTVEAIKAGEINLRPGFVQRFLDWLADLGRAIARMPKSDRRLARDVVEGTIFDGEQEAAPAAPGTSEQVFSLADDGDQSKRTPEERMEAARGVQPGQRPDDSPTLLDEFRRHFRHLDPAKHAEAIATLRELEARLDAATGQAERIILGHVDGLTREQAEAFGDRLAMEDVLRQIDAGEFDAGPTEDGRTAQQIGEQIKADIAKAIALGGEPAAQAYEKRREFQQRHTKALVDADLLDPAALDDPRYYHRQVLAHLGDKQGLGLGGGDARNRTRGFQRGRAGGTAADIPFYGDEEARRDFNTNYAQAEFEYLAQSMQELARADALERLDRRYNQMRAAKAEAKARNRAAMDERWVKEHTVAETGERDELAIAEGWDAPWRARVAMNNSRLAELAMEDDGFGGPYADVWQDLAEARRKWHGENDDLEQADRMPFTFDHPDWWKALSWLAAHQDVVVTRTDPKSGKTWEERPAINALAIFKAVAEREEHIKETLGKDYQTAERVAGEMTGFATWQPEEGLQLVPGWAATDQAITNALRRAGVDDATVADALPEKAPVAGALKRGLLVMGQKPRWLIPEALARQLNDMRRTGQENRVQRFAEAATRQWKLWMLHQPLRVLKYQLNNLVGDLDVALTEPALLREAAKDRAKVARDLWAFTHGQQIDARDELLLRRAQDMGLFDSGVSAAELPDVDKLPALKALFGKGWDWSWGGMPEVLKRYFDSAQRLGRWREAIMRVSAAREFYRQIGPDRRRYAGSRKDELDQLYDRWQGLADQIDQIQMRANQTATDDAKVRQAESEIAELHATIAAKLARELLGDYGNLSHAGMWARRTLIPFWSWAEINAPRYARLIRNARYEHGGGGAQAMGAAAAMGLGLGLRMGALSGLVFAWNAMMRAALGIGDDDDPNKDADASKLMVIVGRGGDGKVYGVRIAGALADALGWLDLDAAWKHVKDLGQGYREGQAAEAGMDVAKDMAMAAPNRILQGLSPLVKLPAEQLSGRQFFPNAFKPRPLSDRWGHLADAAALGSVYRAATDRSGAGDAAAGAMVYTHDPARAAAYRVRDDAEAWARRNGKTIKSGGGIPTDRQQALREAKAAMARGETDRAERWLGRYFDRGGRPEHLGSSKAGMHPLSVLLKDDQADYLKSLDQERRNDYQAAIRHWTRMWDKDGGMTALAGRVWRERVRRQQRELTAE